MPIDIPLSELYDPPYDRSFGDRTMLTIFLKRFQTLGGVPNFSWGSSVLVVGCGYGFLLEYALDQGVNSNKIWGTDISTEIQANKGAEARADVAAKILDIDISAPDAVQQLRAVVGGNGRFNWIVTEDVMPFYSDAEVPGLMQDCEDLRTGPVGS